MTQEIEREKLRDLISAKMAFDAWMKSDAPECNDARTLAFAAFQAGAALEAKQVDVQLPEPTAYLYHDAPSLEDYIANERAGIPLNSACISVKRMPHCRNETPLYTEQQVRALLAQHGINIA